MFFIILPVLIWLGIVSEPANAAGVISNAELKPCAEEGEVKKTVSGVVTCAADDNQASDKGRVSFVKIGGATDDSCGGDAAHCGDAWAAIRNVDDAPTDGLNHHAIVFSPGNWDFSDGTAAPFRCYSDFTTECEDDGTPDSPDVSECPAVTAAAADYIPSVCSNGYYLGPQCSHGANDGTPCVRQCDPTIFDGVDLPTWPCFHNRNCPLVGQCSGDSSACVNDNDCGGAGEGGDCVHSAVAADDEVECVDADFFDICDEDPGNADGITNTCKGRHGVLLVGPPGDEGVRIEAKTSDAAGLLADFSNSDRTGQAHIAVVGSGTFGAVCGSRGDWVKGIITGGGCNAPTDSDNIDRNTLFGLFGSGNSTIGLRTHPFLFNSGKSSDAGAAYIESYNATFPTQEGFSATHGCTFAGLCDDDGDGAADTPNVLCRTDTESPCSGSCIPQRCNSVDIEMDSVRMQTPGYGFVVANGPGYCTTAAGDHDNMETCWADSGTGSCTSGTSPSCVENKGASFNISAYSMQLVQIGNDTDEATDDNETHAQTGDRMTGPSDDDHAAVLARCFGDIADATCAVGFEIKGGSINDLTKEGGGAPERSLWADHGGDIFWAFLDYDDDTALETNSGTITEETQNQLSLTNLDDVTAKTGTGTIAVMTDTTPTAGPAEFDANGDLVTGSALSKGYIIPLPINQPPTISSLRRLCTGSGTPFSCCTGTDAGCTGLAWNGICTGGESGMVCADDSDCTRECVTTAGAWRYYGDGPDWDTTAGFPGGPVGDSEKTELLFDGGSNEYIHTSFRLPAGYSQNKFDVHLTYRSGNSSTGSAADQCWCFGARDFGHGETTWSSAMEETVCNSGELDATNAMVNIIISMTPGTYAAGNHVGATLYRSADATGCAANTDSDTFDGRLREVSIEVE